MPFFTLCFCEASDDLKHILAHTPNGTPLCCGKVILRVKNDTWIYWLNDEFVTPERIREIQCLNGIKEFEEMKNVPFSIHDPSWTWDNDYIHSLFMNGGPNF